MTEASPRPEGLGALLVLRLGSKQSSDKSGHIGRRLGDTRTENGSNLPDSTNLGRTRSTWAPFYSIYYLKDVV